MSSTLVPTILEASRTQPLIVDGITQKPTEAGVSMVYAFDPREAGAGSSSNCTFAGGGRYQTTRGRTTG
jgi:hypothetical protein